MPEWLFVLYQNNIQSDYYEIQRNSYQIDEFGGHYSINSYNLNFYTNVT